MFRYIGDKYSYPELPQQAKKEFKVLCKEHGIFLTTPDKLRRGCGCNACSIIKRSSSNQKSFEDNLKDFILVHGDKYIYSEPTKKATTKFNVTCRLHGNFLISPNNHKAGKGCPTCAKENRTGGLNVS